VSQFSKVDPLPRWGFRGAFLGLLVLIAWVELTTGFAYQSAQSSGSDKWGPAVAFFFCLLPFFGLLTYKTRWVFSFFRAVQVGVLNLVFIALGAMLGVLIHQENPDNPLPENAISSLAEWQQEGQQSTWDLGQQRAWMFYASGEGGQANFRNAQTFFFYHLIESLGGTGLLGLKGDPVQEKKEIQRRLSGLDAYLPEIESRFGPELSVAVSSQSQTGLETQIHNRRISQLESKWNDSMWNFFVLCDKLDLVRVYRSDWYSCLWATVFLGVLINTFRGGWRRLLKPRKWGFVMTHLGILCVVSGGFWGRIAEERGILNIRVGESNGQFQLYALTEEGRGQFRSFAGDSDGLPFSVKLDGFRADQHDLLDVIYVKKDDLGNFDFEFPLDRQPQERVWENLSLKYDWQTDGVGGTAPLLELHVSQYIPQADILARDDLGFPSEVVAVSQADFYHLAAPAIYLEAKVGGKIEASQWLSGAQNELPMRISYQTPDGHQRMVFLRFREERNKQALPVEWRSKITLLKADSQGHLAPVHAGEIRVNDYLHYEGYRFFQTSHDPNDPLYSGIGVVYDPGLELVLTGLWMVMLGVATVFLVTPLFTRQHRGT